MVGAYHGGFCLLIAALPDTLLRHGASTIQIGAAVGAFGAGAIGTRLTCARVMDSLDLVRLFRLSGRLLVAACLGYLLAGDSLLLTIPRMVHGAAFALFSTAVGLWITRAVPEQHRGRARGLEGGLVGLCVVLGPLAGLALCGLGGLRMPYGVMLLLAMVALWPPLAKEQGVAGDLPGGVGRGLREPLYVLLAAGVTLGALQAFLPVLADWKHSVSLPVIFMAFGIAMIVGRLGGGWGSDLVGRLPAIRAAAAAIAGSLGLLYFAHSGPALVAACSAFGLGLGALTTTLFALVNDRVAGREDAGRTLSTASLCWELGVAAGPVALGAWGLQRGADGIAFGAMLIGLLLLAAASLIPDAAPRADPARELS